MSTVTTNYGLTKPAGIEEYNLATYNNNLDLIDTAIKAEAFKMKHAEWSRIGQNDAPANTPWGPGMFNTAPLNKDVDKNSGFVVPGAGNDQLKVTEEGVYAFSWTLFNGSGGSHGFWLKVGDPGNTFHYASIPLTTIANGDYACLSAPNFWMPANTTFQVRFFCTGANQLVNQKFRLTKTHG